MLKYVYAIISSAEDYIVEQAFISMYSLKNHNPEACITLVTDQKTYDSLDGERGRIREYIDEIIIEYPPEHFSPVEKSRFLKTSLRRLVTGDFLYIDNDTIIMDSLRGLDDFPGELGAVKDFHQNVIKNGIIINRQLSDYLSHTKKKFWDYPKYFNGGVFLARDTAANHKFFNDWHDIWNNERVKFDNKIDQPALAQANEMNNHLITELDGVFNCQLISPKGMQYMFNSVLIHYFANSPESKYFPLNNRELLKTVREKGITPQINEVITCPLKFHLITSVVLSGEKADVYNSPVVIVGRIFATKHKWSQAIARLLLRIFGG